MEQHVQGRIQDFKLGGGGAHLKKLCKAEGGAKFLGVFRVKNHDFTSKIIFFPILGGSTPPGSAPDVYLQTIVSVSYHYKNLTNCYLIKCNSSWKNLKIAHLVLNNYNSVTHSTWLSFVSFSEQSCFDHRSRNFWIDSCTSDEPLWYQGKIHI